MSALSLRPATATDAPRLAELAQAAYGHYVERLGGPPRPMTDDYAEVVRGEPVTVAERGMDVVGMIVFGLSDEGFVVDNVAVDPEKMTENLALYSGMGYVEFDRRRHGDACLVYLRKALR